MDLPLLLQHVVIAAAVIASAIYLFRSRFPRAARALRLRTVAWLLRPQRAAWLQQLGRRLAPAVVASGNAACGSCSGCD